MCLVSASTLLLQAIKSDMCDHTLAQESSKQWGNRKQMHRPRHGTIRHVHQAQQYHHDEYGNPTDFQLPSRPIAQEQSSLRLMTMFAKKQTRQTFRSGGGGGASFAQLYDNKFPCGVSDIAQPSTVDRLEGSKKRRVHYSCAHKSYFFETISTIALTLHGLGFGNDLTAGQLSPQAAQ